MSKRPTCSSWVGHKWVPVLLYRFTLVLRFPQARDGLRVGSRCPKDVRPWTPPVLGRVRPSTPASLRSELPVDSEALDRALVGHCCNRFFGYTCAFAPDTPAPLGHWRPMGDDLQALPSGTLALVSRRPTRTWSLLGDQVCRLPGQAPRALKAA